MVSVVIPCYNAAKTIVTCLKSVATQTYRDLEIVLVDDGSTDETCDLIEAYRRQSPFSITLIKQANGGPSRARNKGIGAAKGSWVAFLDSDDQWEATKLEVQLTVADMHPHFSLIGTAYNELRFESEERLMEVSFQQLLLRNYFNTPTVLVRRSVLQEYRFADDQRHSEDYRVWLLICKNHRACLINQVLAGSIDNKQIYGQSGLSANLWAMEKGELSNYKYLLKKGYISHIQFGTYSTLSMLKYVNRLIKVKIRNAG